jgi:CheY-like chemotaxis protein
MDSVLVVDDDPAFCQRIVAFLQELLPGREVVTVGDGNAALTHALELRPRYVLLDVSMPGPNGLRVANALIQALPSTEVVILSGSEEASASDAPAGTTYVRKDERMEETLRALLA